MSRFRSPLQLMLLPVVLVSFAACGGDSASPPPSPAALSATVSTSATATVGTAVTTAPTVRVVDDKGAPVANVSVQFAVTAGGGTLGRTSATTDATGSASAGSWTLGTTAGTNTVDATVSGLTAIRFSATGTAGAAASLTPSGDGQSANVGVSVATAPAVVVKDQYGNVVAGTPVTFAIASGNGAITGATATSGTDGIARVGSWTLGIATGAQQLRASAGTLSATLSATATVPSGCTATNYALGATLALSWDTADCASTGVPGVSVTGRRYDRLQFTTTAQQTVEASVTGASGRALLLRNATSGLYVGLQPGTAFSPVAQNPMRLRYVLAPGSYVFEPHAPDASATGAYTFATTTGANVSCDYIVFATTGVQFSDSVKNTTYNCTGPTGFMEQWVNLQLKAGTKVRISLINPEFPALLVFRDDRQGPASPTLATKQGVAGQTLTIDWTATFDTWHEIIVAPLNAAGGKYTLKIEELP